MEKTAHPALCKVRHIHFASMPPPKLSHAQKLLGKIAHLEVSVDTEDNCLTVRYDLSHHTLEELEELLVHHGHHLDNSLLHKIKRALIYHSESCLLENLRAPTREQRLRSIYLSSAHPPEHRPNIEPANEYLDSR
jgi:hypothetical protein